MPRQQQNRTLSSMPLSESILTLAYNMIFTPKKVRDALNIVREFGKISGSVDIQSLPEYKCDPSGTEMRFYFSSMPSHSAPSHSAPSHTTFSPVFTNSAGHVSSTMLAQPFRGNPLHPLVARTAEVIESALRTKQRALRVDSPIDFGTPNPRMDAATAENLLKVQFTCMDAQLPSLVFKQPYNSARTLIELMNKFQRYFEACMQILHRRYKCCEQASSETLSELLIDSASANLRNRYRIALGALQQIKVSIEQCTREFGAIKLRIEYLICLLRYIESDEGADLLAVLRDNHTYQGRIILAYKVAMEANTMLMDETVQRDLPRVDNGEASASACGQMSP